MPEAVLEMEAVDVSKDVFEDLIEGVLAEDPDALTPLFSTSSGTPDFRCCCCSEEGCYCP
jgi:hypothetical protein